MKRRERGVALILVLGSIAIMTVMLTEFQDEATGELSAALADRDAIKAEYLARSGINLSRLLLASQPIFKQALGPLFIGFGGAPPQIPIWEYSGRILSAFNDKEATADFAALTNTDPSLGKNLGVEGGRFDVEIVDEDSKVNVNAGATSNLVSQIRLSTQLLGLFAGDQYNSMFEQRDRDDNFSDRAVVCGAIIDWSDFDDDLNGCDPFNTSPSSKGTEDISYQLLKKPYFRKNSPFDSLDELHLVRGVGDDFWSTFVDPEPGKPKKRVLTVWGKGAVNVNTANAQALLAVVLASSKKSKLWTDPQEAQKFLVGITLLRGLLGGIPIFGSTDVFIKALQGQGVFGKVLAGLGIEPVPIDAQNQLKDAITAESKVFSIYADGVVPGFQRKTQVRIHTVVDMSSAPALPSAPPPGAATPSAPPPPSPSAGQVAAPIQAATQPNPAGTIIYYRVE